MAPNKKKTGIHGFSNSSASSSKKKQTGIHGLSNSSVSSSKVKKTQDSKAPKISQHELKSLLNEAERRQAQDVASPTVNRDYILLPDNSGHVTERNDGDFVPQSDHGSDSDSDNATVTKRKTRGSKQKKTKIEDANENTTAKVTQLIEDKSIDAVRRARLARFEQSVS
ncbi:MAG: hypothetical protein M1820_005325 [Bogoriella megaspora]|nr:MAG: hypothetical protein M1820_005325 [Bogoriella megaspora]